MGRFAGLVPDEGRALRQLKVSGALAEAWSPGRPGAVLVIVADDIDSARRVIDDLPLAKAGLMTAELVPLYDMAL